MLPRLKAGAIGIHVVFRLTIVIVIGVSYSLVSSELCSLMHSDDSQDLDVVGVVELCTVVLILISAIGKVDRIFDRFSFIVMIGSLSVYNVVIIVGCRDVVVIVVDGMATTGVTVVVVVVAANVVVVGNVVVVVGATVVVVVGVNVVVVVGVTVVVVVDSVVVVVGVTVVVVGAAVVVNSVVVDSVVVDSVVVVVGATVVVVVVVVVVVGVVVVVVVGTVVGFTVVVVVDVVVVDGVVVVVVVGDRVLVVVLATVVSRSFDTLMNLISKSLTGIGVIVVYSLLSSRNTSGLPGAFSVLSLDISIDAAATSSDSYVSVLVVVGLLVDIVMYVASTIESSGCSTDNSVLKALVTSREMLSVKRFFSMHVYTDITHTSPNSRKFMISVLISAFTNLHFRTSCKPNRRQARGELQRISTGTSLMTHKLRLSVSMTAIIFS